MRKAIFFSTALLLSAALTAQNTQQPVVILQTTGKVSLISQGKTKANPVMAGAVANPTSTLKLAKGASAMVYCGGQYKTIKDTDKAELNSICGNAPAAKRMDIDHDLGEKIMAAVDMVAVAKARGDGWVRGVIVGSSKGGDGWGTGVIVGSSKGGDGWGTGVIVGSSKGGDGWGTGVIVGSSKGGDGWGGKGSVIHPILPYGKVSDETIDFQWSKPGSNSGYQLVIKDETGKLVHQMTSTDTFMRIDLKALNLEKEKVYRWQVWTTNAQKLMSPEYPFSIYGKEKRQAVVDQAIQSSQLNFTNSPELKVYAEAIALEKEEWYYDAAKLYANSQGKTSGNLHPMMHAAFWRRYGFIPLCEKAIRSK